MSKHGVTRAEPAPELLALTKGWQASTHVCRKVSVLVSASRISTGLSQQPDPRDASPACGLVQQAVVVRVRVHLCLRLYQALGCSDCLMLEGSFDGTALPRILLIHICTVAQKEADQWC